MKITYLHQYFNNLSMNGGTRSFEIARRLVKRGHQVRMVTSWRENTDQHGWFVTDEEGVEVHWLPVQYSNEMGYYQRLRAFFRFAIKSARRASTFACDVVVASSTPLTIALPGIYASRRRKVPMVFEVRDLWPDVPIALGVLRNPIAIRAARLLERIAYQNAARIIALSPGMASGISAKGYPQSRVTVIPNGCDLDLFEVPPEAGSRFRERHAEIGEGPIILYAGALGKVNGVGYMVRVAVAVGSLMPDARFVVIGSGSESAEISTLAVDLDVMGKNFFLYPYLPKMEVVDAFSAASIVTSFVTDVPACEHNSANKFFDGLAAGRPVAINYGGWQAELLESSNAGLVLSRDPERAAKQIVDFLRCPENLQRAGKCARSLGECQFARDKLADRFESVLITTVEQEYR